MGQELVCVGGGGRGTPGFSYLCLSCVYPPVHTSISVQSVLPPAGVGDLGGQEGG